MIHSRRVPALVLAVGVSLAGCGGGDLLDGTGSPASGSQRGVPSGSATSGTSTSPTSAPSTDESSSASAGSALTALTALTGTATTVQLDPGFVSALGALKITPGLLGTARLAGGALVFPVTGGTMTVYSPGAPRPASGSVDHAGSGFTLAAGGTTISIDDVRIDIGQAPQFNGTVSANGKVVVRSATVFDINDDSLRATGATGSASVSGIGLRLDSGMADLLNTSFKTQAFTSGLVFGTATLALTGS